MGLSNGTTVTIAQYYGAGKMERVRDVVDTTYTFFTLAVVPITVVALLIARPVLVLMREMCIRDSPLRPRSLHRK